MKKLISVLMAAMMVLSSSYAQTARETIRERKQISKYSVSELNKKASKAAKKEAKTLKKQGWVVAPGQLPLEKQLDRSYAMYYEFEESGLPRYIIGDAMSTGEVYDAANRQARQLAIENIAGQIQTEVTALLESTVSNEQIAQDDAASIARTVSASKSLIAQRLGRVVSVIECYKTQKNGTVQVRVTLAYNARMAIDDAKSVVRQQLEEKGQDLHNQLDAIWNQFGK